MAADANAWITFLNLSLRPIRCVMSALVLNCGISTEMMLVTYFPLIFEQHLLILLAFHIY